MFLSPIIASNSLWSPPAVSVLPSLFPTLLPSVLPLSFVWDWSAPVIGSLFSFLLSFFPQADMESAHVTHIAARIALRTLELFLFDELFNKHIFFIIFPPCESIVTAAILLFLTFGKIFDQ